MSSNITGLKTKVTHYACTELKTPAVCHYSQLILTYPDVTRDELIVSSDGHLLSTGVGHFEQSSKVGVYVVGKVVQLYSSQQINGRQMLTVTIEHVHLQTRQLYPQTSAPSAASGNINTV